MSRTLVWPNVKAKGYAQAVLEKLRHGCRINNFGHTWKHSIRRRSPLLHLNHFLQDSDQNVNGGCSPGNQPSEAIANPLLAGSRNREIV